MRGVLEQPAVGSGRYRHIISAAVDLFAGSAGGAACVLVGQPLDTVKVKMQTFPSLYKNSLDCLQKTFSTDGIKGLYAGTVPSLAANIAENAVLFCAYGVCQKLVKELVKKENVAELNPLENASAGFLAAFFSSVALCPTELVKCRLQAAKEMKSSQSFKNSVVCQQPSNKRIGPVFIVKSIFKDDGITGFFRGFVPTVAREMPGYFFFFGSYEMSKVLFTPKGKSKDDLGIFRTIICGGIGGICFWLAIFPMDLIKSRSQISSQKESMIHMTRKVIKNEGIRGLYKGLGPTLFRTFPATGVLFVTVEYTKLFFNYILD